MRPTVRLVTLVGAPGVGKTRLALEVALALLGHVEDGVFFVSLAPLRDPELMISAIAQTLGVREIGGRPLAESLADHLRARHLLLVLDNFEHLAAAGPAVAELLAACPLLKVLATSRAPLHVYGERELPVPPLALPDLERLAPPAALAGVPSVALFLERAQAVRPDFGLTRQNAAVVAEICHRLDGLPLALELAAARIKLLPPRAILARLGSRLEPLAGGARDLPARHQTLRAAIAWSHDLLAADKQRLLRRLAAFAGGWTLEAAEAVCNPNGDLAVDVLDGIASLVDHSLVQEAEQPDGEPRFSMLETVREYGLERLEASGETDAVRRRHAEYCMLLAEQAEPALRVPGPTPWPQRAAWYDRLEQEHGNLRAALDWLAAQGDAEWGLRLGAALYRFWWVHGYLTEGRERLGRLLTLPGPAPAGVRAKAAFVAGSLALLQGDYAAARPLLETSLALGWELADEHAVATALYHLGVVAQSERDHRRAAALFAESLALGRKLGDTEIVASSLMYQGLMSHDQRDYARARALLQESLALWRSAGDRMSIARLVGALGYVALDEEDCAAARAAFDERLAIVRELGRKPGISLAITALASLALAEGDYAAARQRLEESVAIWRETADKGAVAFLVASFAELAAAEGRLVRASQLAGAAEALRETYGSPTAPGMQLRLEHMLERSRQAPRDAESDAAWAAGRGMSLEQAIAFALASEAPAPGAAPPPGPSRATPLSPREREVAALVARGLTNRQIADVLVISERTAEGHVERIRGKLGFTSRARVAAWAVEHGLLAAPESK